MSPILVNRLLQWFAQKYMTKVNSARSSKELLNFHDSCLALCGAEYFVDLESNTKFLARHAERQTF